MMHILSIGLDQSLFDKKSDAFIRHKFYASCVGSYAIVVFTLALKLQSYGRISVDNLQIIPTNSRSRWFYPLDALVLSWKLHKENKMSLVTVQDPFMTGVTGGLIKLFLRLPLNVQVHSEFFNSPYFRQENLFNWFLYYLGLWILPFADTIRARNNRIKQHLIQTFPKYKNRVFYVGVRINEIFFEPQLESTRDQNLVISAGRFVKQKNFDMLKKAFAIVKGKIPEAKLVLVGDGPGFIGWKKPQEIKKLYDRAALFVLSSNHEGWGLVVLEALARGCPAIMTETGCAGEIVINGKTGYVVPIGSVEKLTERIIEALTAREKSLKMALAGRKLVEKDCDLKNIKKQLIEMYQKTITV